MEINEHTKHVFGAKSSPTSTIYALHQVANDNAVLLGYVHSSSYECDFYLKAFGQQWGKHGRKSCQQITHNSQKIAALIWEKKGQFQ